MTKQCIICHKDFESIAGKKTCSKECLNTWMKAYRRTPEFKAKSKAYSQTAKRKEYVRNYMLKKKGDKPVKKTIEKTPKKKIEYNDDWLMNMRQNNRNNYAIQMGR